MRKTILAATLVLSWSAGMASAASVAPGAAALSPYTATRLGHRPRDVRKAHCQRKAEFIGVKGKALAIYMRKCAGG